MNNLWSRILGIFLGVAILAVGITVPTKSEATGLPVFDAAVLSALNVKTAKDIAQWVKEDLAKSLRDLVAKRIIDYIVDQTVQWVQGGGKPKYVSDWNGFLKDAANIAFDQVVHDVRLARLCSPFGLQLQLSLLPVPRFSQRLECTVDQFVSNITNFYTDFSQGGWLAYNELWQPQNNYFGSQLQVADQILLESARRTEAATKEAQSGGGFLSTKKCLEPIYTTKKVEKQVCDERDKEDGKCIASHFETRDEQTQTGCAKEEIITPGSIIGKSVGEAITSDQIWATNIQSWTSALINAVINRLITEGVSGLKSSLSGGGVSGGGATYYPPSLQGPLNTELARLKQQMTSDLQTFLDENQYLLKDKTASLSYAKQILSSLQTMQKKQNCSALVSDSEIQTAQNNVSRLTSEVSDLQGSVNELTNFITSVRQAATVIELGGYQQNYGTIFNRYNTADFRAQIITGSARQAADQEVRTNEQSLSDVQRRLSTCMNISTGGGGGTGG